VDPTNHHLIPDAWTLVIVVFRIMPTVHLAQLGSGLVIGLGNDHFRLIVYHEFDTERRPAFTKLRYA
jgi:cell shape-determining protein MreD